MGFCVFFFFTFWLLGTSVASRKLSLVFCHLIRPLRTDLTTSFAQLRRPYALQYAWQILTDFVQKLQPCFLLYNPQFCLKFINSWYQASHILKPLPNFKDFKDVHRRLVSNKRLFVTMQKLRTFHIHKLCGTLQMWPTIVGHGSVAPVVQLYYKVSWGVA